MGESLVSLTSAMRENEFSFVLHLVGRLRRELILARAVLVEHKHDAVYECVSVEE
jgi:hypothetical protein